MEAKLCGAQECFTGSCKPIWASPSGAGFSDSSGRQGRKPLTFLFVASCYLPLFYPLQAELRREKEEETKNAHALAPTSLSQPSLSPRPVFCLAFRPERSQTFESRETEINQSTEPFCPAHPPHPCYSGSGKGVGVPGWEERSDEALWERGARTRLEGKLAERAEGLWGHPSPGRFQVGTAALGRVPETLGARGRANRSCFCGARSRAWLGAAAAASPLPAHRLLSSRGHRVALGPPRRVSASASAALVPGSRCPRSSGSAQAGAALRTPSPGSRGRQDRRASGGSGRGGGRRRRGRDAGAGAAAAASPTRAVGARRASEEAPRPRSRGCPPGSPRVSPRAPAGARQRAEPPGSSLGPAGGTATRRRRQPGSPSSTAVPAALQPARAWARGAARRAAGPAKFASPLGAEARARPGPASLGRTESPDWATVRWSREGWPGPASCRLQS